MKIEAGTETTETGGTTGSAFFSTYVTVAASKGQRKHCGCLILSVLQQRVEELRCASPRGGSRAAHLEASDGNCLSRRGIAQFNKPRLNF
jgi:hypothetical protein